MIQLLKAQLMVQMKWKKLETPKDLNTDFCAEIILKLTSSSSYSNSTSDNPETADLFDKVRDLFDKVRDLLDKVRARSSFLSETNEEMFSPVGCRLILYHIW